VIHSSGTSMDEISGDLGVRLPAADAVAWADAMRQAIEAPAQMPSSERQRRIARARTFDWATTAKRVRAAYEKLSA